VDLNLRNIGFITAEDEAEEARNQHYLLGDLDID
jgi:hypothetical protein